MNISSSSFKNYPFSKLYKDYVTGDKSIQTFFEFQPLITDEFIKRAKTIDFPTDRSAVVASLIEFNRRFNADEGVIENIKKLEEKNSYTVVTGQQVMLYGGPLFTIYKIITAITTAQKIARETNSVVIPVFWVADEDHDYEEVSTLTLLKGDEPINFTLEPGNYSGEPVATIRFNESLDRLRSKVKDTLPETDFTEELWALLDHCYRTDATFGNAFGTLILKLFGKHGLILAGSNQKSIKQLIKEPLLNSVRNSESHHQTLTHTSQRLFDNQYHNQVTVQGSNIFRIADNGSRLKLQYESGRWYTGVDSDEWSEADLLADIETRAERYSPNVFLRPVIQNFLIPVISYIAGPSEIAYYAQMKDYYRHFNIRMPVITPRLSATVIESAIDRILAKLPFDIHEYSDRIEDLEKRYIEHTDAPDLEKIFSNWKADVTKASKEGITNVGSLDPTLTKSAEKTVALFFTELDKLKGKLYRSVKESEKTQLERIQKIKNHLYPDRNLQEREIAFIYYMNKYGVNIWDDILQALKDEEPDTHKLIKI